MSPLARTSAFTARTALAALAAVLVMAACGGDSKGGGPSASASPADRRRMPSCGTYTAPAGELADADRTARACFLDAFRQGEQKELTITVTSIEGDPITTIYRVLGAGDLELFVDASADEFAAVKTYHQRCTSVDVEGNALNAGGCVDLS